MSEPSSQSLWRCSPSRISVFFAPVRDTPNHIRLAEELGFDSAWVYDSPLLYGDPFVTLALAATQTSRIGLGIGVSVPGLRSPVATACAVRSLADLAPGRLRVAIGAGFTGRFTLGLGPVALDRVRREVQDLRALLSGADTLHIEGGRRVRPIPVRGAPGDAEVPIYVSCRGPKAQSLANEIGDGAMTGVYYPGGLSLIREVIGPQMPMVVHAVGTVSDDDEPLTSPRIVATVGPVVGVAFHAFAEQPWRLDGLEPGTRAQAEAYIASVDATIDPELRHQELHRGHLVDLVHDFDSGLVTEDNVRRFSFTGAASELRARIAGMERDGVTELAIQPGGDVPEELRRLAALHRQ